MVVIDSGHGVDTYGKASPVWSDDTQLFEYEFNRDITKRISRGLDKYNIKNNILVPEVIDLSLKVRCDRANKIYEKFPDSFLLSIHGNAGTKPNEGTGWEIWTSPGETESDRIATYFYNEAKKVLTEFKMRSDYVDGDPDKESKFYILTHTNCPAVLTENLFFDNEIDCHYMMSEKGRENISRLHIDAIINYLKSN